MFLQFLSRAGRICQWGESMGSSQLDLDEPGDFGGDRCLKRAVGILGKEGSGPRDVGTLLFLSEKSGGRMGCGSSLWVSWVWEGRREGTTFESLVRGAPILRQLTDRATDAHSSEDRSSGGWLRRFSWLRVRAAVCRAETWLPIQERKEAPSLLTRPHDQAFSIGSHGSKNPLPRRWGAVSRGRGPRSWKPEWLPLHHAEVRLLPGGPESRPAVRAKSGQANVQHKPWRRDPLG